MSDTANSGSPLVAGPALTSAPISAVRLVTTPSKGATIWAKSFHRQQPVEIGLGRLGGAGLAGQIFVFSSASCLETASSGNRLFQRSAVTADSFWADCAAPRSARAWLICWSSSGVSMVARTRPFSHGRRYPCTRHAHSRARGNRAGRRNRPAACRAAPAPGPCRWRRARPAPRWESPPSWSRSSAALACDEADVGADQQ